MKSRPIEKRKLKEFGFFIGGLFLLFAFWMGYREKWLATSFLSSLASFLLFFSFWKTTWLALLYRLWMGLAHVLGFINSRILLGLFFYCVLTPVGLLRRMIGGEDERFQFKPQKNSYWIPKESVDFKDNMRHSF